MIFGTGVDVEKIVRVERLIDEHASRLNQIYTQRERNFCEDASLRLRVARYAAAFAAKEAVMKALGTGWAAEIEWKEIETLPAAQQEVRLSGTAARFAESRQIERIIVSVSTTREIAMAIAIAEKRESGRLIQDRQVGGK